MAKTSSSVLHAIAGGSARPAFVLFAAIALAAALAPELAFAQAQASASDIAQARELFNQGLKLRDEGDVNGALEKFKAAYSLAQTPITALELGADVHPTGQAPRGARDPPVDCSASCTARGDGPFKSRTQPKRPVGR